MAADATPSDPPLATDPRPMAADRGVALVGFMGSGKSTVGRALAARVGWPHVDLDAILAARFGPVPEQVRRDEAAFRRNEAAALAERVGGAEVLSLGGGSLASVAAAEQLALRYRLVWLDVPLERCRARVGDASDRPMWDDRVEERFRRRCEVYAARSVRIDADAGIDEVVERIVEAVWSSGS